MGPVLEANKKQFAGSELQGKTLGVLGLGAIGSLIARLGLDLGMEVVGYDPAISVEAAWRLPSSVKKMDNMQSLFARSDYVSLHIPVLDSTRGLSMQIPCLISKKTPVFSTSPATKSSIPMRSLPPGQG